MALLNLRSSVRADNNLIVVQLGSQEFYLDRHGAEKCRDLLSKAIREVRDFEDKIRK